MLVFLTKGQSLVLCGTHWTSNFKSPSFVYHCILSATLYVRQYGGDDDIYYVMTLVVTMIIWNEYKTFYETQKFV